MLLIAGGVGITPMRALLETRPRGHGEDVLLLYRARAEPELLFRAELDHIAQARGARVEYVLGDAPTSLSATVLQRLVPDLRDRDVYLCGPPGLAGAVRTALQQAGLPKGQLHEERFAHEGVHPGGGVGPGAVEGPARRCARVPDVVHLRLPASDRRPTSVGWSTPTGSRGADLRCSRQRVTIMHDVLHMSRL